MKFIQNSVSLLRLVLHPKNKSIEKPFQLKSFTNVLTALTI